MTLTTVDLWSLALTVAIIAGALLLEHVAFSKRLSRQDRYAMGLVTDMGLLLTWAVLRGGVILLPLTAVLILCAGCLGGLPLYIVLRREQATEAAQWDYIVNANRELASELALLKVAGNGKRYSRAHNLVETVAFIHGGFARDLHDLEILVNQLKPLLGELLPNRAEE